MSYNIKVEFKMGNVTNYHEYRVFKDRKLITLGRVYEGGAEKARELAEVVVQGLERK